jgi:hypothetical protein
MRKRDTGGSPPEKLDPSQRRALGRTMALLKHWRRLIRSSAAFGPAEARKANDAWIADVIDSLERAFYETTPQKGDDK